MFFKRKERPPKVTLAPATEYYFSIRSGRHQWVVKSTDTNTAMNVWFFSLPEGIRLGEYTFAIRIGDHKKEEWVWATNKILEFYNYNKGD